MKRVPVVGSDLDKLEYDGNDLYWNGKKLKMELSREATIIAVIVTGSSVVAALSTLAQAIHVWFY